MTHLPYEVCVKLHRAGIKPDTTLKWVMPTPDPMSLHWVSPKPYVCTLQQVNEGGHDPSSLIAVYEYCYKGIASDIDIERISKLKARFEHAMKQLKALYPPFEFFIQEDNRKVEFHLYAKWKPGTVNFGYDEFSMFAFGFIYGIGSVKEIP